MAMRWPVIEDVGCVHVQVSDLSIWTFVTVQCSDGISGVGEASKNTHSKTIESHVRTFGAALRGQPAVPIVSQACHTQISTLDLSSSAAVSAIEQALWDALGKRHGVSVSSLLGGRIRDRIELYANINRGTKKRTPGGFSERAKKAVCEGFQAVKIAPFDGVGAGAGDDKDELCFTQGMDCIAAVRETVSREIDVMVDCHGRLTPNQAERLIEFSGRAPIYWIEAPLPETHDHIPALRELKKSARELGVKIAGMENGLHLAHFVPYFVGDLIDVLNPDVKYAGGISVTLSIAQIANACGLLTSLHNPAGPVSCAASLAVSAVMPQVSRLELQFDESPLFSQLINGGLKIEGGEAVAPDAPGLGVDLVLPERLLQVVD